MDPTRRHGRVGGSGEQAPGVQAPGQPRGSPSSSSSSSSSSLSLSNKRGLATATSLIEATMPAGRLRKAWQQKAVLVAQQPRDRPLQALIRPIRAAEPGSSRGSSLTK